MNIRTWTGISMLFQADLVLDVVLDWCGVYFDFLVEVIYAALTVIDLIWGSLSFALDSVCYLHPLYDLTKPKFPPRFTLIQFCHDSYASFMHWDIHRLLRITVKPEDFRELCFNKFEIIAHPGSGWDSTPGIMWHLTCVMRSVLIYDVVIWSDSFWDLLLLACILQLQLLINFIFTRTTTLSCCAVFLVLFVCIYASALYLMTAQNVCSYTAI